MNKQNIFGKFNYDERFNELVKLLGKKFANIYCDLIKSFAF